MTPVTRSIDSKLLILACMKLPLQKLFVLTLLTFIAFAGYSQAAKVFVGKWEYRSVKPGNKVSTLTLEFDETSNFKMYEDRIYCARGKWEVTGINEITLLEFEYLSGYYSKSYKAGIRPGV